MGNKKRSRHTLVNESIEWVMNRIDRLLNYEHQPTSSPNRSAHAIYVAQGSNAKGVFRNELAPVMRTRIKDSCTEAVEFEQTLSQVRQLRLRTGCASISTGSCRLVISVRGAEALAAESQIAHSCQWPTGRNPRRCATSAARREPLA